MQSLVITPCRLAVYPIWSSFDGKDREKSVGPQSSKFTVDVFTKPSNHNGLEGIGAVDRNVDKLPLGAWPLESQGRGWPEFYLPIRMFRSENTILPINSNASAVFRSSGTTSGPDGRSKSGFSDQGFEEYRRNSLAAFKSMLFHVGLSPDDLSGVSLIPGVDVWPDSSLARMVHWIGEEMTVVYADYLSNNSVKRALNEASKSLQRPVFLFATAFHLIDFLDQGIILSLPPGSVVIETGGTKGKTRSVTRPELYELISKGFGISKDQIVSEYGMCELASQAYDFVPKGQSIDLEHRRFRFPWWASVLCMRDETKAQGDTSGALVIWDRARVDLSCAIQTEDLAYVYSDQSFKLLGRLPLAPLKGCSLKVDELTDGDRPVPLSRQLEASETFNREELCSRLESSAERVYAWLHEIARNEIFRKRLCSELGLTTLGAIAQEDFRLGLPSSLGDFRKACLAALGERKNLGKIWLVIPPSSHSIAALYSLAILFAFDLEVTVRSAQVTCQLSEGSALDWALALADRSGIRLQTKPSQWRLGTKVEECSLMVFGSDETVASLQGFVAGEVIGFGNNLAATAFNACELTADPKLAGKIVRDNVSLAQRGCMSARLNFVKGVLCNSERERLISEFANLLSSHLPRSPGEQAARAIELVRIKQLGAEVFGDAEQGWNVVFFKDAKDVAATVSKLDFMFIFNQFDQVSFDLDLQLTNLPDLRLLALSKQTGKIGQENLAVSIGQLNAARLDGRHLGRPALSSSIRFG